MRYLSVCSGIEAATVAWHPLGWVPVAFSEIEENPRAILAHHYPDVPLHGDFTTIGAGDYGSIDLLVGGTPCQSFSIAGLRGGLADDRGNLALQFCRLAHRKRPRWVVWENVPGALSVDGGRAFASILGGLAQCGYGLAYRVLDAQYIRVDGFARAVPQRRRRVFVVGCLGSWQRAAAVLFERESLLRNPPPRQKAGKDVATTISARPTGGGGLGTDFDLDGGLIAFGGNNQSGPIDVATACRAKGGSGHGDFETETFVVNATADTLTRGAESSGKGGYAGRRQEDDENLVAHALRADGFDASEDGTGRGTPIAFNARQDPDVFNGHTGPLDTDGTTQAVAFDLRGREGGAQFEGLHNTANLRAASGGSSRSYVAQTWAVRRLTPVECERLQGFPDTYTAIPTDRPRTIDADMAEYLKGHSLDVWCDDRGRWRTNILADGPRYKALGNSMAVNVMRWIGKRIESVDSLLKNN